MRAAENRRKLGACFRLAVVVILAAGPAMAQGGLSCRQADLSGERPAEVDDFGAGQGVRLIDALVKSGALRLPGGQRPDGVYALRGSDEVGLLSREGVFICRLGVVPRQEYERARASIMGEEL